MESNLEKDICPETGSGVTGYTSDFNELTNTQSDRRKTEDFDDLQHAMSGTEVGRQRKHIQGDGGIDPATGKKRKTTADLVRETLDWLLLNNPEYALLHSTAMTSLARAEATTQSAIDAAMERLDAAQVDLDEILNRATRLPDGTRVFRTADGTVLTEDGETVDAATAAGIEWRGDEPTYEDYLASKEAVAEANTTLNDLRQIETDLGGFRNELTDQNTPPSAARVESINGRVQELQERAEQSMTLGSAQEVQRSGQKVVELDMSAATSIPVMPKT